MARIPRDFIDQLLDRLDIVEVINARVPLKRQGAEYSACCPFHDEKTPSFTVSPSKQFYHCFGCGAHGTAFDFVMEHEHLSFPEAVEELATSIGMPVPREMASQEPGEPLKPLYDINAQASDLYRSQLRNHPDAARAIDYLKSRGLTGEIALDFGLGFAPAGWDSLLKAMLAKGWNKGQLLQAGLISEPEPNKVYDRMRERIIFPIRDLRGRVIGFGGRLLGTPQGNAPKYLNSPETPVFHKGRQLYGLFEARKALRHLERLLIVEGYMDVVMLAQQGIRYAVATLGTATTAQHLELLFRHVPQIIFCFDGDRAGREAAWKALKLCLPQLNEGREVRFLFLPDGEDPDSLVQKEGQSAFEVRINGATALSDYLFAEVAQGLDLASPDGRARYGELMRGHLEQLPSGLFAQMLWQRLARAIELPLASLQPGFVHQRPTTKTRPVRTRNTQNARITPAQKAMGLLLGNPQLANLDGLPQDWQQLDTSDSQLLRELIWYIEEHPDRTPAHMIEYWRASQDHPQLQSLSSQSLNIPEAGHEAEFRGCLERLSQEYQQQQFNRLIALSRQRPLTPEETKNLLHFTLGKG